MTFLKLECLILKIFDTEFPYKCSCFEPLCLPANMVAETVKRSVVGACSKYSLLKLFLCKFKSALAQLFKGELNLTQG